MSELLVRSLEIASDYVDAAGPDHPVVRRLVAANAAWAGIETDDWMTSAQAVHDADRSPDETSAHLAVLVAGTQDLADDLGLPWRPTPAMRAVLDR